MFEAKTTNIQVVTQCETSSFLKDWITFCWRCYVTTLLRVWNNCLKQSLKQKVHLY